MKSVIIDTNVILRLILGDIPSQSQKASKIFKNIEKEESQGIISLLVINELLWVLENFYLRKRVEITPLVLKILSLKKIKIKELKKLDLIEIIKSYQESSLDLTDLYLFYFSKKENVDLITFDKKLKRKLKK